jgi:hypothetical protein
MFRVYKSIVFNGFWNQVIGLTGDLTGRIYSVNLGQTMENWGTTLKFWDPTLLKLGLEIIEILGWITTYSIPTS